MNHHDLPPVGMERLLLQRFLQERNRDRPESDGRPSRTREEVQQMREKHDPIDTFGARLVRAGIVREDELKAYDRDVRQVINHAAEFATESPEPALEELYTDILK